MKIMKKSLFLLLLLSFGGPLFSMNPMVKKWATPQAIRNISTKASNGIHFGLWGWKGIKVLYDTFTFPLVSADPIVEQYVKDVLKEAGYKKRMIDNVNVRKDLSHTNYAALNNNIMTPLSVEKIKKMQKSTHEQKINSLDEEIINSKAEYCAIDPETVKKRDGSLGYIITPETKPYSQFVLTHEGAHVYSKDMYRGIAALGVVPVLVHVFCKNIGNWLNPISIKSSSRVFKKLAESRIFSLGQGFGKLCFGLPFKYFVTLASISAYKQKREYAADLQAIKRIKDPNVFETVAQGLEANNEFNMVGLKKKFGQEHWVFKHPWLSSLLADPVHPPASLRARYLRKAAQELEKKNNRK